MQQTIGCYKKFKISEIGHSSTPININILIICCFGHDFLVVTPTPLFHIYLLLKSLLEYPLSCFAFDNIFVL